MLISRPVPTSRPPRPFRKRKLAALTTLGLAGLLAGLLAGCGGGNSPGISAGSNPVQPNDYSAVAGNWKFTTGSSARLSTLSGSLAVAGSTVTGTLHPLAATCADPTQTFQVAGTIATNGLLSITSSNFLGGQVAISGILSTDLRSLPTPTITVTGGACATPALAEAGLSAHTTAPQTAQQYQPLTGNYNGTFVDMAGVTLPVNATLSQPTTPDSNGVYHLTGYATFLNNPCVAAPVVTDSTITGDSLQATYTDPQSGAKVIGTGTFSADAQTLTITDWILSGCGHDTGTGQLTRQRD